MVLKFKLGYPYYIKFIDHMKDCGEDEVVCEIMGWVKSSGKNLITVVYWNVISKLGDKQLEADNEEIIKLAKKTIIDYKLLKI